MISLFADLLLCRGAFAACIDFNEWRKSRPIRCAAGPAISSAPELRSSCESYCSSACFDNSSNPMAAVFRVGAKSSFKRVVLCLKLWCAQPVKRPDPSLTPAFCRLRNGRLYEGRRC